MALRINVPPFTRVLLVLLLSTSLLNAIIRFYEYTVDSPQYITISSKSAQWTPIWYPWVVLTTTLVEQNLVSLLISVFAVFFGGRYLERAWGGKELAKFLVVVAVVPNATLWILYAVFDALLGTNAQPMTLCGTIAVQSGFLVAFKQLVPEHTVAIAKGIIKMRLKHFPALFLLFNALLSLFILSTLPLALSSLGFLTSWLYLRFYKRTTIDASSTTPTILRGDASETFTLASFFPEPLHTPLALLTSKIWNLVVALKICTPFSTEDVDASNEAAAARGEGLPSLLGGRSGGGSGARAEAERRRALALKALDQRLHAASARTGGPVEQPVQPPVRLEGDDGAAQV
ncbi:MAG: hypothetical protein M1814_000796 [Vezdaea aestivalis]|nr:MAG: hypothetical protein M1814_000796 [Vezdaea aestivalis]